MKVPIVDDEMNPDVVGTWWPARVLSLLTDRFYLNANDFQSDEQQSCKGKCIHTTAAARTVSNAVG